MIGRKTVRCKLCTIWLLVIVMMLAVAAAFPARTYAASVSDLEAGDYVDVGKTDAAGYTGVPHWRVLDKMADGRVLLLSEYLWTGNGEDAGTKVRFINASGSDGNIKVLNGQTLYWRGTAAEAWCKDFRVAVLGDIAGLTVLPTSTSDDEFIYTQKLYGEDNNKELHFAAGSAILYENSVFFLSAEELDRYIPDPKQRVATLPGSGTGEQWLLRSSQAITNWASEVKPDGEITPVRANTGRAARPAFWARFDDDVKLVSEMDHGVKTWLIYSDEEQQKDPEQDADQEKADAADKAAKAEAKAKKVKTVTVNAATVNAKTIDQAVKKAGGSEKYVTKIVLSKKVKKISKGAFKKYSKVKTIEIRSKKLKKSSVKNALAGSKVSKVKVSVGSKKVNKKYIKTYKKIFTKKVAGRKVKVA